ncbi:hypothetical protein A6A29_38090 [Streptomyces sp. TSRI0281]|nr:hypothetical protein A6A29_38090 [Streptomyces sp. TSRI0281]
MRIRTAATALVLATMGILGTTITTATADEIEVTTANGYEESSMRMCGNGVLGVPMNLLPDSEQPVSDWTGKAHRHTSSPARAGPDRAGTAQHSSATGMRETAGYVRCSPRALPHDHCGRPREGGAAV